MSRGRSDSRQKFKFSDDESLEIVSTDVGEEALNDGKVFIITRSISLNNGADLLISFLSVAALNDVIFDFRADNGQATWEITSGGTPTGGNVGTPYNPNIDAPNTQQGSVLINPTIADDTQIDTGIIGGGTGGNAFGGEEELTHKLRLPTAIRINLCITSNANGNVCTIRLIFIEDPS